MYEKIELREEMNCPECDYEYYYDSWPLEQDDEGNIIVICENCESRYLAITKDQNDVSKYDVVKQVRDSLGIPKTDHLMMVSETNGLIVKTGYLMKNKSNFGMYDFDSHGYGALYLFKSDVEKV